MGVDCVPTLSIFFGIIVRMYAETGGQHNQPHIHAEYQGQKVVVNLQGDILEGALPKSKMHMLLAWIAIHQEDLTADWELLSKGEQPFKIDPLR